MQFKVFDFQTNELFKNIIEQNLAFVAKFGLVHHNHIMHPGLGHEAEIGNALFTFFLLLRFCLIFILSLVRCGHTQ